MHSQAKKADHSVYPLCVRRGSSVFDEIRSTYGRETPSGAPKPSCPHPERRDRATAKAAIRRLKEEDAYLSADEKQFALLKFGR